MAVVFANGKVLPRWMMWRGRKIELGKVLLEYQGKDSGVPLLFYSVQGATSSYGVVWNKDTNIWKLVEVHELDE